MHVYEGFQFFTHADSASTLGYKLILAQKMYFCEYNLSDSFQAIF